MKVFLGGTCNESAWRDELIPKLTIDYFNPVVEDWTPECQAEELRQRARCDICLYVITPKMTGVYAIAEMVDDAHRHTGKTAVCFIEVDGDARFDEGQIRSLAQVGALVERAGALWVRDWSVLSNMLNNWPPWDGQSANVLDVR